MKEKLKLIRPMTENTTKKKQGSGSSGFFTHVTLGLGSDLGSGSDSGLVM